MSSPNDKPLKITLDDIANVAVPEAVMIAPTATASGAKSYGTINETAE